MNRCLCNVKIRDLLKQNTELQQRNSELVLENRKLKNSDFQQSLLSSKDTLKKRYISYNEYGEMLQELTDYLLDYIKTNNIKFDAIFAPPRGAVPIAIHLSHHLDIDNIINVGIIEHFKKQSWLLIDDIVDTGKTMINIKNLIKDSNTPITAYTASLFYKSHSDFKPDYYVYETSDWIVFPWEKLDEKPNRKKYEHL